MALRGPWNLLKYAWGGDKTHRSHTKYLFDIRNLLLRQGQQRAGHITGVKEDRGKVISFFSSVEEWAAQIMNRNHSEITIYT